MMTLQNITTRDKEIRSLEKIEEKIEVLEKKHSVADESVTREIERQLKFWNGYAWAIQRGLIKEETLDLICL